MKQKVCDIHKNPLTLRKNKSIIETNTLLFQGGMTQKQKQNRKVILLCFAYNKAKNLFYI